MSTSVNGPSCTYARLKTYNNCARSAVTTEGYFQDPSPTVSNSAPNLPPVVTSGSKGYPKISSAYGGGNCTTNFINS